MAQSYNTNTTVDLFLNPMIQISNSLTATQTVTQTLPTAMVTEVRLYANGNQFFRMAGADLDKINQYFKVPASTAYQSYNNTNFLMIPFNRMALKDGTYSVS